MIFMANFKIIEPSRFLHIKEMESALGGDRGMEDSYSCPGWYDVECAIHITCGASPNNFYTCASDHGTCGLLTTYTVYCQIKHGTCGISTKYTF